jgi:hypothetical protein
MVQTLSKKQIHMQVIGAWSKATLDPRLLLKAGVQRLFKCEHNVFRSWTYANSRTSVCLEIRCYSSWSMQQCVLTRDCFTTRFLRWITVCHCLRPPRSPYLTTPDVLLWGFLREIVRSNNPRSLKKLKRNIEHIVADNEPEKLHKVVLNTIKVVDACLREGDVFSLCYRAVLWDHRSE